MTDVSPLPVSGINSPDCFPVHQVVVLTFDQLSVDVGQYNADFAEFERQAVFFEQHYSQNICRHHPVFSCFGSRFQFQQLRDALNSAGMRYVFKKIGATECRLSVPARVDEVRLLWLHVQNVTALSAADGERASQVVQRPETTLQAGSILREVRRWKEQRKGVTAAPVTLIVTAERGGCRRVTTPFASAFPEDCVRVPLWIDCGREEVCRTGAISGSGDLLPTIADLLLPGSRSEEDRLFCPRSLMPFCGDPGRAVSRSLLIQTDPGEAIRTPDFLVIRHPADSEGGRADIDARTAWKENTEMAAQLYLKPEDFWNVNDQAVVYESVVAELMQNWPCPEQRESGR